MRFAKAEALGNDFILVEASALRGRPASWARKLCDRCSGVGADGLLLIGRSRSALHMRIFNADGSEAELSGNGLRCVVAYACWRGWARSRELSIRTKAGPVLQRLHFRGGRLVAVTSLLAAARFPSAPQPPLVALQGRRQRPLLVDVGNPHAVLEVRRFEPERFRCAGAALERARNFPRGLNVEFARRRGPNRIEIWIWERGVGETRASGSGAAAAYAALRSRGRVGPNAQVRMAGGVLRVAEEGGRLAVTGPAHIQFFGEWVSGAAPGRRIRG